MEIKKTKTILILEVDAEMQDFIADPLLKKFTVIKFDEINKAIDYLETKHADVIISNLDLKDDDKTTVLQTLKNNKTDIPLILTSGNSDIDDGLKALKQGAFDYISKPLSKEKIYSSVNNAIEMLDLKEAMIRSQKKYMESEKIASISLIIMNIMHELSTPLTVLKSINSEIEKKINEEKKYSELKKDITRISHTADHLFKIVSNVKNAQQKKESLIQKHSLKNLVEKAYDVCKELFQVSHVKFSIEDSKDSQIEVNDTEIIQVLINLYTNSIQALEHTNEKWVKIKVGVDKEKSAFISITDSGPGVSPQMRDQIFIPFYSNKKNGSGLGLSTSLQILISHKGKLILDHSQTNTCFKLIFPHYESSA